MTNNFKRSTLIIGILVVLFFIASSYGVQRTILSTFAKEQTPISEWFTTGAWLSIAFTLSGFGLFKALAGLFTGAYTEKIGKRRIIVLGASCFTLGSLPLLFSQGNAILLGVGNSILGAGEGLLYAGAMTYLSDVSTPARRAQWMGIMELSVYGGYSFGAMIAGFIAMVTSSFSTIFIFSAVLASIGLIFSLITVQSTVIPSIQEEMQKLRTPIREDEDEIPLINLLTRPTVMVTFLNGHISKMVDSIIVLFLPLIISLEPYGYGFTIEETGLITAVFTLTWAFSMPFAGRISDWIGRKKPIFFGLILEAIALIGLQWGSSPFLILFSLSALGGVGLGLYYPILPSMAVDIAPDAEKSKVIGIYRAVKDLGYFSGPILAGFVAQIWYDTDPRLERILQIPLGTAAILLLIGALSIFLVSETRPGWAQFQTTLQHAQLVEDCVIQATKGLIVYLEQEAMEESSFQDRLSRYTLRAKDLEHYADQQLEKIAVQTYQSIHKSPDAQNFLRIARRLDRVGGLALGALFRIQMISLEAIPPMIQEKLHDASIALRSMVRITVDILQVLDLKLEAVAGVYRIAREKETELDLLYQMMNRQLFLSAPQIHYGTWQAIKDVVTMIEQAADSAEDAAEVINILAIKYKT
ncbi:MAG: MFS transporter [Candidatus Hodarchaeota archaeon]